MSSRGSCVSKRLQVLLLDFGLPVHTTDVRAVQASYRRLAKLHHPDRAAPERQAEATEEFASLQARLAETLQLLEKQKEQKVEVDPADRIYSHGGLFYHDPYKWQMEKRNTKKQEENKAPEDPEATVATKLKGISLLAFIFGAAIYVFDRTASGRSLLG